MKPKISFSLGDLPIAIGIGSLFELAKKLGVDGVEITTGVKTRFSFRQLDKLSQKHSVPILSFHQPPWAITPFLFDEGVFKLAKYFNAQYVAHPSHSKPFNHPKTIQFLTWLSKMSKKHNVEVLIENMPNILGIPILEKFLSCDPQTIDLRFFPKICKEYGFGMTLDLSHLDYDIPQQAPGFKEIEPFIKNIHVSSFTKTIQHQPLGTGRLDHEKFFEHLKKIKYDGLLTLELDIWPFYPREKYFKDIKSSITIMQKGIHI